MVDSLRAQQTQQKFLFAAFSLLKDGGIKKLSAAQIAKAAGMSKSTFFHHFAQIDDFYLFMLDSFIAEFNQQAQNTTFEDYQHYIRFSLNYTFDFIDTSPEIFTALLAIMDQSRNNPDTMKRFENMCKTNISNWANYLAPLLPNNFSLKQTERLAYLIDIHFLGLCQHYLIDPDKNKFTQINDDFISMISLLIESDNT